MYQQQRKGNPSAIASTYDEALPYTTLIDRDRQPPSGTAHELGAIDPRKAY